ncbi:MAG: hypothetical protein JO260_09425, partial [Acidobacteria bacterium]|nr:hypothetical protein [Acidobacteriota bacterium]
MVASITDVPATQRPELNRKALCASWRACLTRSAIMFALLLSVGRCARSDNNNFDLLGPRIEMKVSRNGRSLPISQVANLQPGDRLWLHPDFPDDQSARYLLIVAFLRGATNPPSEAWFTKAETWTKPVKEEGI